MAETNDEAVEVQEQKTSLVKKMLIPAVIGLVLIGGTVGALNFFGIISLGGAAPVGEALTDGEVEGDAEAIPETAGSAAYFFSFYPDLLVNFNADGQPHYLKLSIDVMSRNEEAIKGVEEYHPIMRNNILKLFQQVKYETVKGQEGMEYMQAIALEEVRRVLKNYHSNNEVEGVYFTTFVVQ